MNKSIKLIIAVIAAALMCAAAAAALLCFNNPMDNTSYNLSMFAEDGEESASDKGWTVFINEAGAVKELSADGIGGYYGLDYPGQTFYFKRTMNEALECPTVRIGTVNRTVSVFLDDTLIYTDCPDADNRIGYVQLPMLKYDRAEPVIISLPPDYHNKTLTIAQSSPLYSEKQGSSTAVYPSDVLLYCGYSYESALIADASKTVIPAALMFFIGLSLLIIFVWSAAKGRFAVMLPILALAAFFGMCEILASAPFFFKYFNNSFKIDLSVLFFYLSIGALLILMAVKAVYYRYIIIAAALLQWSSVALSVLTQCDVLMKYGQTYVNMMFLPQAVSFISLLAAIAYSFLYIKKGSVFHKIMSRTALGMIICCVCFLLLCITFAPEYLSSVLSRITGGGQWIISSFSLHALWRLCLISSIAAFIGEIIEKEIKRRFTNSMLSEKIKLTTESYNKFKARYKETMMLKHDMNKHYTTLRRMADSSPEKISGYLDELIGNLNNMRPIVDCENETMNILINGSLSSAIDKGIRVDIVRADVPAVLPISDSELCSLVVNVLDNAVNAAAEASEPYIRLDLHCKNDFFIFSCENNFAPDSTHTHQSKAEHGYGLKIINQIAEKYGNMASITKNNDTFNFIIAFAINPSDK